MKNLLTKFGIFLEAFLQQNIRLMNNMREAPESIFLHINWKITKIPILTIVIGKMPFRMEYQERRTKIIL